MNPSAFLNLQLPASAGILCLALLWCLGRIKPLPNWLWWLLMPVISFIIAVALAYFLPVLQFIGLTLTSIPNDIVQLSMTIFIFSIIWHLVFDYSKSFKELIAAVKLNGRQEEDK